MVNRVVAKDGVIAICAAMPFAARLVMSNEKQFKYEWTWEKSKATNYLNAKHQPMRAHELVYIFYPPSHRSSTARVYNPQMIKGDPYNKGKAHRPTDVYGGQTAVLVKNDDGFRYPRDVLYFKTAESEEKGGGLHPTQKPVALTEYTIKTYTNPGGCVLDPFAGSGTTGVAVAKNNRHVMLIEKDPVYAETAKTRMDK